MFGLTELTVQLDEQSKLAIIPTVVIPFTILGMILTSLATWVAALFGVQLKAEGPKRLFELMMKPKILISALAFNAFIYGAYYAIIYFSHSSQPLWLIKLKNSAMASSSIIYSDTAQDKVVFSPSAISRPRQIKTVKELWQTDLKSGVFAGITPSGESLWIGANSGTTYELDVNSGKILREIWTGQPVSTRPNILNGKLYFGEGVHETHHARYYQFDLATGQLAGSFESTGHIERNAIVAEILGTKVLIFPAGKDGLYAVEADSMRKIWQASVGHVDTSAVSDGETIFIGTGLEQGFDNTGTSAVAIDLKSGKTLWKKTLATSSWGIPIIWKNSICFSVGDVYVNTGYGQLTCFDRKTAEPTVAINTEGALISQPLLIDDTLLTSDLNGVIYQLNLLEKKIDWQIKVPTEKRNYSSITVDAEDRILYSSTDGISVFSRKSQELLFQWKPKQSWKKPYSDILIYRDLWLIADGKGKVYALRPVYE